ncbi:MAG: efflux transporter outer membrane subunit [Burkholderiales bacterium]|nr:efflux transporter outer membrane subunit [Burkholderiales bacterium]
MKLLSRLPLAASALSSALLLAACVDLAPAYQRPEAPVAAAWPAALSPASAPAPANTPALPSDAADIAWRDFILDDRLRRVIALALANNRDLRVAVLNVEQSRARYRIQDAARLPAVSGGASFTRSSAGGITGNNVAASVGLSAYEIDLFGHVKDANAAALQAWLSTTEGARSARISLVAEVATQWLALAADAQTQRLNERTLALDDRSLDLNRRMHDLGAIKGLPVVQAQAALEAARGAEAAGRSQLQLDRNALRLLVGQELPEDLLPVEALPAQSAALLEVPGGLPSRVLQQRPDVLAAEHSLQQAQLEIGVARAAFFPTITLTGSAGTSSPELSGLFKSGSGSWSVGPSISLPIFTGGALQAGLDSAKAGREIALANYDKAVQTAFREVADALAVRATLAERLAAQQAQTRASEAALRDADALFRNGSVSYLEVLVAQRSLYASQQSEIALNLTEQDNRIALYKALGGGWKESN